MSEESLQTIAKKLVEKGKGILAADESTTTVGKRFASLNIENTEENRRSYRELLFSTQGIEKFISGVIMYDETIHQSDKNDVSLVKLLNGKGIFAGVKVDQGLKDLDNSSIEKITTGLDGLNERLMEYYSLGARFAKWRAVFTIGDNLPSEKCIKKNAEILAKYAVICQKNNTVPIVEPEVLMDGTHTIEQCCEVTMKVLKEVFNYLKNENVDLSGMLLKPNMIINSLEGPDATSGQIAEYTLKCLNSVVPSEVPGIVFLSGGQREEEACENLDEINKFAKEVPWKLTFSYGRALQNSALKTWAGQAENVLKAQKVFAKRAEAASLASQGKLK